MLPVKEVKGSPVKKDKESPVEKRKESPTTKVTEGPVKKVKESPVEKVKERPVEKMKDSPVKVKNSPVEKVKNSPVEKVRRSPVKKVKRSPVKKVKESPVKKVRDSPVKKVKESPVKNVNESPAKKSKRPPIVSAVKSKLDFTLEEEESISPRGTSKKRLDFHEYQTSAKDEDILPSGESVVSQNLLTERSGTFSGWDGLGIFKVVESTFPEKINRFLKLSRAPSEGTKDLKGVLTGTDLGILEALRKLRHTSLYSGGGIVYADPNAKSDLTSEQLVTCFYCRSNDFLFPPILKYKLDCIKHGGDGACESESYTEEHRRTIAEHFETKYLHSQYQCFMCFADFSDLQTFKCHLKCRHYLNDVTLCQKCLLLFQ